MLMDYLPASDSKEGIDELCPVCGDRVSGYHYGLLTCESCKGFFKRTVQNKKMYTCVAERTCHIDKSQRKRCPYCRFQKCLEVGMKLEAVRADRMRGGRNKFGPMYKRDRARKLQIIRQKQLCIPGPTSEVSASTTSGMSVYVPPPSPLYTPQQQIQLLPLPAPPPPSQTPQSSGGLVKQELIQIPQLSSSTSSPDSSSGTFSSAADPKPLWIAPYEPNLPGVSTKYPVLIRQLSVSLVHDKDWQANLFGLLQEQSYNQCEVDTFELMCKVVDQCLFGQVDWARNSVYFKELKVDDQMKLLQNSWSELLLLDHLHQKLHHNLPDETTMANGQKFDLAQLALLGLPAMADQLARITSRLKSMQFDTIDYLCLKFLTLVSPEVRSLQNNQLVRDAHEHTQQALLDYCLTHYPSIPDKFQQLIAQIPDLRAIGRKGEEFLYFKHVNGNAPTQTLLMEMLHAFKK